MRPGTRVVSNAFDMADWQPDQLIESEIGNTRAFLWIVPANVHGEWTFTQIGERFAINVALEQKFQELQSTPATQRRWAVPRGRLQGSTIELTLVGANGTALQLQGKVPDGRIDAQTTREGRVIRYVGQRSAARASEPGGRHL